MKWHRRRQLYVVAVDLGGSLTRVAVIRDTKIISRVIKFTPAHEGPPAVINELVAAVQEALKQAHITLSEVVGMGIGAPGLVNEAGTVVAAANLTGWHDVALGTQLSREFSVPVIVQNDAVLAGFGEYRVGAGRGVRDAIYMSLGTGIGGGVFAGGELIRGAHGMAGDIGHMIIDPSPTAPVDAVGHTGCLEAFASGTALAREAAALIASGKGRGILLAIQRATASGHQLQMNLPLADADSNFSQQHVSARDVVEAARQGDGEAQALIRGAARALAIACVSLSHCLDPEVIIIGGGLATAGSLLLDPLQEAIAIFLGLPDRSHLRIVPAQLGDDAGLLGTASYLTNRIRGSSGR